MVRLRGKIKNKKTGKLINTQNHTETVHVLKYYKSYLK